MQKHRMKTLGGLWLELLILSILSSHMSFPQNVQAQENDSDAVVSGALGQQERTIQAEVFGQRSPCCGSYFTSVDGDYKIVYSNTSLPWGVRVYFYYGFKEVSRTARIIDDKKALNWQQGGEIEMVSTSPFVWEASFRKQLTNRGFSTRLADLQFVFKIIDEKNITFWERGNQSIMGYYQAADLLSAPSECTETAGSFDNFCPLSVTSIYNVK